MGQHVILHRFGDAEVQNADGSTRTVRVLEESGVYDVDADDNPDWVTEALAARADAEPEAEQPSLSSWSEPSDGGNVAATLDTVEFGEDPSRPEGYDDSVPEPEETVSDGGNVARVMDSVDFGVESDAPEDDSEDAPEDGSEDDSEDAPEDGSEDDESDDESDDEPKEPVKPASRRSKAAKDSDSES